MGTGKFLAFTWGCTHSSPQGSSDNVFQAFLIDIHNYSRQGVWEKRVSFLAGWFADLY